MIENVAFYCVYNDVDTEEIDEIRRFLNDNDLDMDDQVEVFVVGRRENQSGLVACAGLDHATIKCVAIDSGLRGEKISLTLGSRIIEVAASRGVFDLFLYSSPKNRLFFRGWGFYPLVEVPDMVMLMENSSVAIGNYCRKVCRDRRPGKTIGAIVMNANPFTLGHRSLAIQAAKKCDWLHVFLVREEASMFSYAERHMLVVAGLADIKNVTIQEGSNYIVSRATFPGYFLKDKAQVDRGWAAVDLLLFREYIGPALGITHRFVGTEPFDATTRHYNTQMRMWLQGDAGLGPDIDVVEIPRISVDGEAISASEVRELIHSGNFARIARMVPNTTLEFLRQKYGRAHDVASTKEVVK
ncbi:[citrate (pro-3S)-lyase] ligase [Nguyenibacter vanlangensis]|uniref:[Citrate [pro-3S]-lyase] ligase n=1 Tax=Nguyenibacter vanlangensis TaxID=1216886 RepID=A0ABZ3D057_9PROT